MQNLNQWVKRLEGKIRLRRDLLKHIEESNNKGGMNISRMNEIREWLIKAEKQLAEWKERIRLAKKAKEEKNEKYHQTALAKREEKKKRRALRAGHQLERD